MDCSFFTMVKNGVSKLISDIINHQLFQLIPYFIKQK